MGSDFSRAIESVNVCIQLQYRRVAARRENVRTEPSEDTIIQGIAKLEACKLQVTQLEERTRRDLELKLRATALLDRCIKRLNERLTAHRLALIMSEMNGAMSSADSEWAKVDQRIWKQVEELRPHVMADDEVDAGAALAAMV